MGIVSLRYLFGICISIVNVCEGCKGPSASGEGVSGGKTVTQYRCLHFVVELTSLLKLLLRGKNRA